MANHNYRISFKKHILPSASRKRVDDADAFNDLSVINVFGQQRFATGGFSRAELANPRKKADETQKCPPLSGYAL